MSCRPPWNTLRLCGKNKKTSTICRALGVHRPFACSRSWNFQSLLSILVLGLFIYFLHIGVLVVCASVYLVLVEARRKRVDSCKPPFECWELNLGPLFLFLFFEDLFILYMWVHCHCLQIHQKRASDPITGGCEPPCGCWDLNSRPPGKAVSALNCWDISPAPRFIIFLFCVWVSAWVYIWAQGYMPSAHGGQKRAPDPLELEFQEVWSHHVGGGNCTCVLCKSSQCS